MVWYADTIFGCNYYQALFCAANVSEGDALEFNVTDRIRSNTTGHTVTADEIDRGCIFNNLTLPQPPPLADRSVMSVHTGSDITEPALFMVYGWVFYDNGSGCGNPGVNISMQWQAETDSDHYYYQLVLDAANVSVGNVLRISASKDGEPINSTMYNITPEEVSDGAAMVDLNEGSVDLAVSEISHPAGFYADRSSTITAVVENDGTAYTDGFEAAMFVDGILIETTDVPSMGHGGNRSVNFNWMPELEGNYTIVVMVDSGRTINETDESNNNRSMAICVRFTDIDLVITDGIALNKTPLDGDVVRVDATIEDQGNISTEDFTVVFYDNDDAFHTELLSLDAGGSDTVSACWDASYGEHDIRVIIDPDNMIWETDETNNEGSLNVFVNASRDFAVTNVTFALDDPFKLEWGKTVTINATIEAANLANRACSVKVEFYRNAYDWNPRQNINETELLFGTGNSTQYLTVEWHIEDRYSIGDLYMTAVIDPDDEIHEPDESNNEMVIPIHVKACDFTVTDITANMTSVTFGEIVELNATIENLGDAAGSVDVAFMANSADVPESRVISVSNVSMDAGGTGYVTVNWNTGVTDLAGNCTIAVEVDPDYR
jgi:subtilase family serine protease